MLSPGLSVCPACHLAFLCVMPASWDIRYCIQGLTLAQLHLTLTKLICGDPISKPGTRLKVSGVQELEGTAPLYGNTEVTVPKLLPIRPPPRTFRFPAVRVNLHSVAWVDLQSPWNHTSGGVPEDASGEVFRSRDDPP